MRRQLVIAAATVAVGFLPAIVLSAGSVGSGRTPAADCAVSRRLERLPIASASFQAGAAGRVVLTPAPRRAIAISSVTPKPTYRALVDKAQGGSVEVYFGGKDAQVVFGAEAAGSQLEVRVTTCG